MDGVAGSIMPAATPVPQALAALVVTVIIAVQSRGLIPKSSDQDGIATPRQVNVFFPAVPLLILVFCAETVILPYAGPVWSAAIVPLVLLIAVAPLHIPFRRRQEKAARPPGTTGLLEWPKMARVAEGASQSTRR
jgi:hypothetical protein